MAIGYIIPTVTNYNTMFGNLFSENKVMSAACIGQCTGCTCSCRCSCKAVEDVEFEW